MNIWGFKKKAKLCLELERYYISLVDFRGAFARKKADQYRGAKEFCLKKVKEMKKK